MLPPSSRKKINQMRNQYEAGSRKLNYSVIQFYNKFVALTKPK
jgi:hypothetical protein